MGLDLKSVYSAASKFDSKTTCLIFTDAPFDKAILENAQMVFVYAGRFKREQLSHPEILEKADKYIREQLDYTLQEIKPHVGEKAQIIVMLHPDCPMYGSGLVNLALNDGVYLNRRKSQSHDAACQFLKQGKFQDFVDAWRDTFDRSVENLHAFSAHMAIQKVELLKPGTVEDYGHY